MNLEQIEGKWYIHYTNFPMWLNGDKKEPFFRYAIDKRGGKVGLKDTVGYYKNTQLKTIKGFDFPRNPENTMYKWRGSGWLFLVNSLWRIDHFAKSGQWMLIAFEKTFFTPSGYDVVSKKQQLSMVMQEEIEQVLTENNLQEKLEKIT